MPDQLPRAGAALVDDLFARSDAARWHLTIANFTIAIDASLAHAFAGRSPSVAEIERYASTLHVADLALATACIGGHEAAWEHFIAQHRASLYRAADAIDATGNARELADALYADLYGVREARGARQSLLRYFHGRSSLSTWLRSVLSQRHLDRLRANRRLSPLPESMDDLPTPEIPPTHDPERHGYVAAITRALAAALQLLDPRDRLRLSLYYVQRLTLAEIGRLLKEHEGSASRHLSRIRAEIGASIDRHLTESEGLDRDQRAACLRSVLDDTGSIDLTALVGTLASDAPAGGPVRRKNIDLDRSRNREL